MASDDPFCRAGAAARLADLARKDPDRRGLRDAIPALMQLLVDDTPVDGDFVHPLRVRAIGALPITPGAEAASALEAVCRSEPETLLAAVDDVTSVHAQRNLARELAGIGRREGFRDRVIQRLVSLLEHQDGRVRANAAASLENIGAEQAIEQIIAVSPTSAVEAMEIATALLRFGTQRSRDATLVMLSRGSDERRWGAAEAVCDWLIRQRRDGDQEWRSRALGALVTALGHDTSETVRCRIASLIQYATDGDAHVAEALIHATVADPSPGVRVRAISSLSYAELPHAQHRADTLLGLLAAPEVDIRAAAAATASAMLTEDRTAVGRQRLAPLKQALAVAFADPEGRVREAAAAGVGWHADDTAIEMLTEAVISDPHSGTRSAAGKALATVRGAGVDILRRLDAAIVYDQSKARENSYLLTAIWGITGIEGVNYPDRLEWWLKHREEYLQ